MGGERGAGGGSGHKLQINKIVDHESQTLKWQTRADERKIKKYCIIISFSNRGGSGDWIRIINEMQVFPVFLVGGGGSGPSPENV